MRDFPWRRLAEVLSYRKDLREIDDLALYKRVRVRLHARGAELRDVVFGSDIRTKSQQFCRADDVIFAEIDAKVGGYGVVPPELDGAIVSSHYFLFEIDPLQADVRYLSYALRNPRFQGQVAAQGSTNYASIRPQQVLEYKIPLPKLSEQKRIAGWLDQLAEKAGTAKMLADEASVLTTSLTDSIMRQLVSGQRWSTVELQSVCEINPPPIPKSQLDSDMTVSFVPMSAVDDTTGTIMYPELRQIAEITNGYKQFLNGDVVFARITPSMQNGKSAVAEGLEGGIGYGTTEFHVLRPGPSVVPEWLHLVLRSRDTRTAAESSFKGTAGQQRVPADFLKNLRIPLPDNGEQAKIVTFFRRVEKPLLDIRRQRTQAISELAALIPAILNHVLGSA